MKIKEYECGLRLEGHYDIPYSRASNAEQVLDWAHHLLKKKWTNDEGVVTVIEKLCKKANIDFMGKG